MKKMLSVVLSIAFLLVSGGAVCEGTRDSINPDGYEALFSHEYLHEIEIVISQEEWDGLVQDMKDYAEEFNGSLQTGNYRKATFIYRGLAGDALVDEVGFRTKGRFRVIPEDDNEILHRAHFKVKFNEKFDLAEGSPEYEERDDRRFYRLRKLVLRAPMHFAGSWDKSQMQELYCYDVMRRAGAYTSRTGSTRLTITIGETQYYFGLYTLIEPIDKSFLTKRYGKRNNDGNLYKCAAGSGGSSSLNALERYPAIFRNSPSFLKRLVGVRDEETGYFPTYDLKTNEDEADHTELFDFIDNLNSLNGDALKDYLDDNFEIDRFLRYQAMNVLLGKWDDYWTMGNNYYLYFSNEGRIEFIPFDYDNALGDSFFYTPATGIYEWGHHFNDFMALNSGLPMNFINWMFPPGSPLVERIFEIDAYRAIYEGYIQEFITPANNLFAYSDYEERYNQLQQLYAPYLDNDIDEGEEMSNEEGTGRYFFERTASAVAELDLDEEDYETGPTSLNAPTGVSATDETYKDMITVTWEPVLFAEYYEVYRADSPGGAYEQISEAISATSFNDESVAVDSSYYYKVKAFTNDGIEGAFSLEVSGSTNDGSIIAPTGVSATDGTYNHMITISWNGVLNADYYRVYRSNVAGGLFEQISEDITATIFNDKTIGDYSVYYYKVKAFTYEGAETGFSVEDTGSASATGLSAPTIIRGAALERGTYIRRDETGVTTYTFDESGACRISRPGAAILGNTVLEGTWGYNNDGKELIIDVSASFGVATLHFSEYWENAFTLYNGAVLNLLGFKKVLGDEEGIVGRYEGKGTIRAEIGAGMDDVVIRIEVVFTINDDITWNLEFSVNEDGNVTTFSQTGAGFANRLIEFGGSYYLPVSALSYARIPRPMAAMPDDASVGGILGEMGDLHLQDSRALDSTTLYPSNIPKTPSMLLNSPMLKTLLRDLALENKDVFEEFAAQEKTRFSQERN